MLSKKYRVKKKDIGFIARRGKKFEGITMDIKAWYENIDHPLFTVVISKKIHKHAVVRNSVKRKIKAATKLLLNQEFFLKGKYIFIVKSPDIIDLDISNIEEEIKHTLLR